jgi:hypothetical protein
MFKIKKTVHFSTECSNVLQWLAGKAAIIFFKKQVFVFAV